MAPISHMLRSKLAWIGLLVVLAVILIMGFAQVGSTSNPVPKNMPVALVMLDKEIELPNGQKLAIGKLIQDNVTKLPADGSEPPLRWEIVDSVEAARKGLDEQKYYSSLVIPETLSRHVASALGPQPQAAAVEALINQGMNGTGASLVSQVLTKISDSLNANIRTQLLGAIKAQGDQLNTAQATALATPIVFQTNIVNPVPAHSANGNAPVLFTVLAWFAAMVASMLLMQVSNKTRTTFKAGNLGILLTQAIFGLLYSIVAALSTLLLIKVILGMAIPDTAGFVFYFSLICYCFFLLQSSLLNWFGIKGMPLFVLIFFFGSPILSLPEQMLPELAQNWLFSWIPLRFGAAVFRDLLYFGQGTNTMAPLSILLVIGGAALVLSLLSITVKKSSPVVVSS